MTTASLLIRLEPGRGWRRLAAIGLCVLMALLCALVVPFLRSLYVL